MKKLEKFSGIVREATTTKKGSAFMLKGKEDMYLLQFGLTILNGQYVIGHRINEGVEGTYYVNDLDIYASKFKTMFGSKAIHKMVIE